MLIVLLRSCPQFLRTQLLLSCTALLVPVSTSLLRPIVCHDQRWLNTSMRCFQGFHIAIATSCFLCFVAFCGAVIIGTLVCGLRSSCARWLHCCMCPVLLVMIALVVVPHPPSPLPLSLPPSLPSLPLPPSIHPSHHPSLPSSEAFLPMF
jgi:hypothetical protein